MRIPPIRLDTPGRKLSAKEFIDAVPLEPPRMMKIVLADSVRTLEQNALMFCLLGQLEKYSTWHSMKLHRLAWKDLCSAGLKTQDVIPGINGGFVALGSRTSEMKVKEMSELIEFIYWFGTEKPDGLIFSGFIEKEFPEYYAQYIEVKK